MHLGVYHEKKEDGGHVHRGGDYHEKRKMVVMFAMVVVIMTVAMIKMAWKDMKDGREGVDDEGHCYLFQLQQVDSQNLDSSDHLNI